MNYEDDVSPEKDDEKPIYESLEGPIPKIRGGATRPTKVGKSGTNMINSGESFGFPGRVPARPTPMGSSGFMRDTLRDDFLDENEEEESGSAEEGEMYNPSSSSKKRQAMLDFMAQSGKKNQKKLF